MAEHRDAMVGAPGTWTLHGLELER